MAGGQRATVTFALVCASTLGTFTAQGLLYPALPLYMTDELGTSKAMAGLVMSVVSVSAVAVRPWAGGFVDRVGRRPLMLAGPALFALSAIGLMLTRSVALVLLLRLVQGAASAGTYTAAVAMTADVAPPERRAGFLALFSTFFYVGFSAGPYVAEWLIGATDGFTAVWWAVAGFTVAGALAAAGLRETLPDGAADAPRVPALQRLFHPAARGPGIVFFCIGIGWTSVAAFLSLYAREIGLASSDVLFLALSVTVLATRFGVGGLADRYGRLRVALPSTVAIVVGLAGVAFVRSPLPAIVFLVIFGMGYSGGFPALLAMVADRAPDAERGTAMGSFNVYFDVGAPLGGYGVGQLIEWGGFPLGFGAVAAAAAVGGLVLPFVGRSDRRVAT